MKREFDVHSCPDLLVKLLTEIIGIIIAENAVGQGELNNGFGLYLDSEAIQSRVAIEKLVIQSSSSKSGTHRKHPAVDRS